MKKPILIVGVTVAILALLGIGYYAYIVNDGPKEAATTSESDQEYPPTPYDGSNEAVDAPVNGQYVAYEKDAFSARAGRKVLFFHAPWCPQCRQIDSELSAAKKQSKLPAKLTIYKVDYDSNQDLRQKYGVTLQTTFIAVDSSDELIKKYVAYDEPTFDSVNKNFFDKI